MKKKSEKNLESGLETDSYAHKLYITNPLREQLLREVIRDLQLPAGSHGLDAGCGIGLQTILLAEAVGSAGSVTGLDISSEFLNFGRRLAENAGLNEQVFFQQGDINKLPFEDGAFDWVWSADCAGYGYPATEPVGQIKELARIAKPGSLLAVLIYSSQMLLPGYPILEAQLNATPTGVAPFRVSMKPEHHFFRATGWFRAAGMGDVKAGAYAASFHAPLGKKIRAALASLIDMRWGQAEKEVPHKVWAEYMRLCSPDSPDFILDLPDYYAFFTYSLFTGKVAE